MGGFPIPAAITTAALMGLVDDEGARKLGAAALSMKPWNPLAPMLSEWWLSGRICYRVADELLSALLLTDIDRVKVVPVHECMFLSLAGQVEFKLGDAPVDGVFLGAVDHPKHGKQAAFVAMAQSASEAMPFYAWSFVDPAVEEVAADGYSKGLLQDMLGLLLRVLYYLMDPAHEEAPAAVHGNSEWRKRVKAGGAKRPDDLLLGIRHRVVGSSYRLPSDAFDSDASGRRLGLRHPVRGHIRMQLVGEGRKTPRATWVRPHWRGAGATANQVVSVVETNDVSMTDAERRERIGEAMEHFRERISKGEP